MSGFVLWKARHRYYIIPPKGSVLVKMYHTVKAAWAGQRRARMGVFSAGDDDGRGLQDTGISLVELRGPHHRHGRSRSRNGSRGSHGSGIVCAAGDIHFDSDRLAISRCIDRIGNLLRLVAVQIFLLPLFGRDGVFLDVAAADLDLDRRLRPGSEP